MSDFEEVATRKRRQDGNLVLIENIEKTYVMGEVAVPALRGISLQVRQGEFLAVMGPSGSGKSTLMNILGCLDVPTRGKYFLDGVDTSTLTSDELASIRNQKLGFVFQGFNLLPRITAIENVEIPMLYTEKFDPEERDERAMEALKAVGLGKRAKHIPSQMSGGEQQRVAIARALVNEPSLILADEPTGNLDTRASVEIMNIFQSLNKKDNITVIMVTHESDISRFARRVIHMRDGKLLDDVPVENKLIAAEILAGKEFMVNGQLVTLNNGEK